MNLRTLPLLAASTVLAVAGLTVAATANAPVAQACTELENAPSSRGPFWIGSSSPYRIVWQGQSAGFCGSAVVHTGCRYSAYWSITGKKAFGCHNVRVSPSWYHGGLVVVR